MTASDRRTRRKKSRRAASPRERSESPAEPRVVDAATVAWTVTVSTVVLSELGAAGAHFLGLANPGAARLPVLRDLLLFGAAIVGLLSLVLLPVVYRLRAVKPPVGFTVFAGCAAAAPIIALAVRLIAG